MCLLLSRMRFKEGSYGIVDKTNSAVSDLAKSRMVPLHCEFSRVAFHEGMIDRMPFGEEQLP